MNYLQLCQRFLDEGGEQGDLLTDVTATPFDEKIHQFAVNWVAAAHDKIQKRHRWWKFLFDTGTLTTTVDGTETYTLSGVKRVDTGSLTCFTSGAEDNEIDMAYLHYAAWQRHIGRRARASSQPQWFTIDPTGALRLDPIPDAAYVIQGDWEKELTTLTINTSTPLIPSDHHLAIVFEALGDYIDHYDAPDRLMKRVARQLPVLLGQLESEQLPDFEEMSTSPFWW